MIMLNKIRLKYLVVGTGRCGTVSISRLLTDVGIPCGHESIFDSYGIEEAINRLRNGLSKQSYTSGTDGWKQPEKIIADSSYMAVPYLNNAVLKNTKIIHIVRHPLDVISSFVYGAKHFQNYKIVKRWDNFIEANLPEITNFKTPIEKAVFYYVNWNKKIKSDYFHKIEDGYSVFLKKLSLCDINLNNVYSGKANHFLRENFVCLKDIPEGKLKNDLSELSESYGYDLENHKKL